MTVSIRGAKCSVTPAIRILMVAACLGACLEVPCVATVTILVYTPDGMVVAADSRTTLTAKGKTRVVSDFGEKVKRVGSHVAVTFSGAAHLFDTRSNLRSIGSIVDQYKNNSAISDSSQTGPHSVAVGLDSLLTSIYNNKYQVANINLGRLKIAICGYSSVGKRRIYVLGYPRTRISSEKDSVVEVYGQFDSSLSLSRPGAFPMGQTGVWTRLIKGYDPQLRDHEWFREIETVTIDSLDSTVVDTIAGKEMLDLEGYRYNIRYDLMTLQDAIDFAVFIIRATIESQRFDQASLQGVGGAIDIAVVTPDGFKWIQHKKIRGESASE